MRIPRQKIFRNKNRYYTPFPWTYQWHSGRSNEYLLNFTGKISSDIKTVILYPYPYLGIDSNKKQETKFLFSCHPIYISIQSKKMKQQNHADSLTPQKPQREVRKEKVMKNFKGMRAIPEDRHPNSARWDFYILSIENGRKGKDEPRSRWQLYSHTEENKKQENHNRPLDILIQKASNLGKSSPGHDRITPKGGSPARI